MHWRQINLFAEETEPPEILEEAMLDEDDNRKNRDKWSY